MTNGHPFQLSYKQTTYKQQEQSCHRSKQGTKQNDLQTNERTETLKRHLAASTTKSALETN